MAKRLDITPEIKAAIQRATKDPNFDVSAVAVFESVLADTNPINQRGSLFDKGRLSVSMLQAMVDKLNTPDTVPLQTLHNKDELPTGRVFMAWLDNTSASNGATQLVGLFYVPASDAKLINDIELSVIDSVSIGARAQKVLCSECSFDYLGPDATFMNLMERTCANGHTVGDNGVHVNSVGLDNWYETSLVGQGGVPNARIRSRAAAQMPAATKERLAANGIPAEATILMATVKSPGAKAKGNDMELTALISELTTVKAELSNLKTAKETGDAKVTELTSKATELQGKVDALTAQLAAAPTGAALTEANAKVTALEASAATAKAESDATIAFLTEHATAALTAAGKKVENLPKDAKGLMDLISAEGKKLHQLIPAGGASAAGDAGNGETAQLSNAAFKTARR